MSYQVGGGCLIYKKSRTLRNLILSLFLSCLTVCRGEIEPEHILTWRHYKPIMERNNMQTDMSGICRGSGLIEATALDLACYLPHSHMDMYARQAQNIGSRI
ncbi:hypothetical protein F5B20DRAFT_394210 [Whalleya microplaca]|nr:hypothetical protein F5B20DRAFT_394210 [Whalleya microplaca]